MRRLGVIAAALALAASTCGDAEAKVRCGSGTTAYVEGGLRIFGMYFREPDEWGFNEYACSGRGSLRIAGQNKTLKNRP